MSGPLVVNTVEGTVWTRRPFTRDGADLYAPQKCTVCPEFVMATYAELVEHGIAGEAFALPMPVPTSEPLPIVLSEKQVEALVAAGNLVVNNAVHEDLCHCDAWPETCLSTPHYFMGAWDVGGLADALPAVIALWEQMRDSELARLRARVTELESLLVDRTEPDVDGAGRTYEEYHPQPEASADRLTALFAPTQALREGETGGAR